MKTAMQKETWSRRRRRTGLDSFTGDLADNWRKLASWNCREWRWSRRTQARLRTLYTWILLTPVNMKTVNLELKSFCLLKTLEKQKEAHMSKVVKLYPAKPVRDISQTWHFQPCSGTNHGTGKPTSQTIWRCCNGQLHNVLCQIGEFPCTWNLTVLRNVT